MIDIHGNINLEKLYHLFYDDANFFLKRKNQKFLDFIESLNQLEKRKLSKLIIKQIENYYLSGMKQFEIAREMKIPNSTVRGVIQRLRKRMV
jgi:DNA-directed RNA polymerase specialized sigma24 family protein